MFVAGRESCQNKWVEGLGWQLLFLGEKLLWMAPEDGPQKAAATELRCASERQPALAGAEVYFGEK